MPDDLHPEHRLPATSGPSVQRHLSPGGLPRRARCGSRSAASGQRPVPLPAPPPAALPPLPSWPLTATKTGTQNPVLSRAMTSGHGHRMQRLWLLSASRPACRASALCPASPGALLLPPAWPPTAAQVTLASRAQGPCPQVVGSRMDACSSTAVSSAATRSSIQLWGCRIDMADQRNMTRLCVHFADALPGGAQRLAL